MMVCEEHQETHPRCAECLQMVIRRLRIELTDAYRDLDNSRLEADWLRDEEGKRNAEVQELKRALAALGGMPK